jgi:hypothetical protein
MGDLNGDTDVGTDRGLQERIDTSVVHPARRYDYWLGGKDNYAVDRASGDALAEVFPTIALAAQENRRFMRRAVSFLARENGIRQFLDLGTGLPTSPNVHEIAQGIDPTARVVYVDNDPIVLVHARALLTSSAEGATTYIDADLRDPDRVLDDPELAQTLDLTKPVGLLMFAVIHFIAEDDVVAQIIARLAGALPSGSYVAVSSVTADFASPELIARGKEVQGQDSDPLVPRSAERFTRFLDGFELVPPGVEVVSDWRSEGEVLPRPSPAEVAIYGAVARVP